MRIDQIKNVTGKIKKLGDVRALNIDDVDSIIKNYHADVHTPQVKPANGPSIPDKDEVLLDSVKKPRID